MKLGVFSMSLSVKDIYESKRFYEELGFNVFAGDMDSKYLVMKNGNTLIGLFQDLFEENILTFNPGWDANAKPLTDFDDIRHIQEQLKSKNIALENEVDAAKGPASMIIRDPDGNMILIDQHV